jgi:CubicO group peptidase (beta-lactamase class C family)
MKSFRFTTILLLVLAVLGLAYAVCPPYIRKAVMHQGAGLYDYKIFDNRIVPAGNHQPWAVRDYTAGREIPAAFAKTFKKSKTVAFLVVQNEEIVFERYWGGFGPDTRSNAFSASISVQGLLVGIALDEGWIRSVDQPVADFIPDFRNNGRDGITIRHLLEMSSGLDWDEKATGPFSFAAKAYYGENLTGLALGQQVLGQPGRTFEYKGGSTVLLAMIMEKATGRKVGTYASEKLWRPLGAKNDAWWSLDNPDGIEKAFCCFHTNARDLARLGQLVLFRGSWHGQRLISESFLDQALSPSIHLKDEAGQPVDYFGWHWWIAEYRNDIIYYMRGGGGQYVIVIPAKNAVIVRLGEKESPDKVRGIPSDLLTWIDAGLELAK